MDFNVIYYCVLINVCDNTDENNGCSQGELSIMHHRNIDPYPIPKDKSPIYINEPWLIDKSICYKKDFDLDQGGAEDNIRVYICHLI